MDGLPIEIISSILSWLPVRWLLKCRPVCKTWCSVIDNPEFGNTHLFKINTDNPSSLILLPSLVGYMQRLFIVEDTCDDAAEARLIKSSQIYIPCSDNSPEPSLMGSSHGLTCFSYCHLRSFFVGHFHNIYICNPATQESHLLPQPVFEPARPGGWMCPASGFGFDHSTNKFKVVFICYWGDNSGQRHSEVQVYTLGSNSWRKVFANYPDYLENGFFGSSVVSVNGSLHWLAHLPEPVDEGDLLEPIDEGDLPEPINEGDLPEPIDGGNLPEPIDGGNIRTLFHIVSFDLGLEDFSIVPNPDFDHPPFYGIDAEPHLGVLGGCLCLSDFSLNGYEIWVMIEYNVPQSWTKQYVIPDYIMDHTRNIGAIRPIFFQNNGNLVLLHDSKFLVSYNFENRTATPLEDGQLPRYGQEKNGMTHFLTLRVSFHPDHSAKLHKGSNWDSKILSIVPNPEVNNLTPDDHSYWRNSGDAPTLLHQISFCKRCTCFLWWMDLRW